MVEWSLQLSAKDNKNQEKVNSYAKELNKVYKFEERPDNFEGKFYGLEFKNGASAEDGSVNVEIRVFSG